MASIEAWQLTPAAAPGKHPPQAVVFDSSAFCDRLLAVNALGSAAATAPGICKYTRNA